MQEEREERKETSGDPLLLLETVDAGYRGEKSLAGVNLAVAPGELVALAGPNGGGKSTLLKTAAGLLRPQAGRVLLDGRDLARMSSRERALTLAFLLQNAGGALGWPFTVREVVAQGRFPLQGWFGRESAEDREAVAGALARTGLTDFAGRAVTELSGGEAQRVLIARALAQGARLFLLDEPLNSLDLKYQRLVMGLLRDMTAAGLAVVISLHDLTLAARYATRVVLVSHGVIREDGPPAAVLQDPVINAVFEL